MCLDVRAGGDNPKQSDGEMLKDAILQGSFLSDGMRDDCSGGVGHGPRFNGGF